ncbi:MAG: recombinase family protein [Thermoplasmata archaeon]|nr:recombinase family protein [Thermoplasmata archaeon]
MEEEKKRAALYARVSTDEQAQEGYSLDAQLDVMRAYCDIHELEIAGEYVDDGYSGTNIRRNAYNFMFSPDERKKWDVLIVMKMDRIHRNSRNFMDMMQDLNRHKQQFISTYDRIDTSTAVGRFAMDMIQRIAQLESEQIGERTYMGMREKAESFAGILGFNAPFGYSFEDGNLVIVEDEAEIVREIYNRYQNGSTMDEIAFYLNTNHLLTKNNNPWNKYNLRTVLHNPTYAGYLHWEEIVWKADHEPIIDPEFFNEIQLLIASKIRNPAHRKCIRLETDT